MKFLPQLQEHVTSLTLKLKGGRKDFQDSTFMPWLSSKYPIYVSTWNPCNLLALQKEGEISYPIFTLQAPVKTQNMWIFATVWVWGFEVFYNKRLEEKNETYWRMRNEEWLFHVHKQQVCRKTIRGSVFGNGNLMKNIFDLFAWIYCGVREDIKVKNKTHIYKLKENRCEIWFKMISKKK